MVNRSSLRVFPEVRSAHIDEIDAVSPRRTLYFRTNYDLRDRAIPPHWERVSRLEAVRAVWRAKVASLELFEPLWLEYLPIWMALAMTYKLRMWSHRGVIGVFAIENCSRSSLTKGPRAARPMVGLVTRGVLRIALQLIDRIAYGTEAAEALYAELGMRRGVDVRVTHDLLAQRVSGPAGKASMTAAFVGALHERKGIEALMRSWPSVERALPGARIVVIGDGPLRGPVEAWAAQQPQSREVLGLVDHLRVLEILGSISVLVAPSQRYGRWREQVGRHIQEALAVGATVVTTSETGLAAWLRRNGHWVIDPSQSARDLAPATISALRSPLPRSEVRDSLPVVDGRLIADAWLHGDERSPATGSVVPFM